MPTERFLKLPEEKKQLIYAAAVKEFVRVPFEKASINKVIQSAGISRGSFYTYFDDKRDLLGYIFRKRAQELQTSWLECARANDGDLWKAAEAYMDYSIKNADENILQLVQNIVDFEKVYGAIHQLRKCKDEKLIALLEILYDSVDKKKFKYQGIDSFAKVFSMIMFSLAECMGWYYRHVEDEEKIKEIFREKLDILQYGFCEH